MKSKEEELAQEVERLRRENEALRVGARPASGPVKITVGKYRGYPTFRFEGPFRTFSLGARKVALILSAASNLGSYLTEERKRSDSLSYQIAEGDISFTDGKSGGREKDGDDVQI